MDAMGMAIADAEKRIVAKVSRKFSLIAGEKEARVQHTKELRSWARVADREEYKQSVYAKRRELMRRFVELGICDSDEAYNISLAAIPMD